MQRYRIVILIVLFGVLPVAAAFVFALVFLEQETPVAEPTPASAPAPPAEAPAPAAPAPEKPRVLAAIATLPVGTLLRVDDLRVDDLAGVDLDPAVVRREYVAVGKDQDDGEEAAKSLRGYAVREKILAGDPLTRRAVVGPGQPGFLATVLRPGTRAVAIEVGPATSQAGLIDPGDRVDVILTAELPAPGPGEAGFDPDVDAPGEAFARPPVGGGPGEVLARTIVEDARVVAIDRTTRGVGGPPRYGEEEEVSRGGITTATLEVLPGEDDRLVLGGRVGRLSLAIRSLHDAPSPAGPGRASASLPEASTAAVKLREILSPLPAGPVRAPAPQGPTFDDMAALEDRMLTEFGSLEENLLAAMAAREEGREPPPPDETKEVRIFRGGAPATRVCFQAGKGVPCEEALAGGAAPGPSTSSELPPLPSPEGLPPIPSAELPSIPALELPALEPGGNLK